MSPTPRTVLGSALAAPAGGAGEGPVRGHTGTAHTGTTRPGAVTEARNSATVADETVYSQDIPVLHPWYDLPEGGRTPPPRPAEDRPGGGVAEEERRGDRSPRTPVTRTPAAATSGGVPATARTDATGRPRPPDRDPR